MPGGLRARATRGPRWGRRSASRSSSSTSSRRRCSSCRSRGVITQLDLQDSALGADPRLPVVHDPVRDLAPDGLLQDDPAGARGRGADGRLRRGSKALVRIVLPISLPGILTVVIFAFSLVRERVHLRDSRSSRRSSNARSRPAFPNDLIRGDVFFWPVAHGGDPDPERSRSRSLYNAFLDRFITGLHGRSIPLENRAERRNRWQTRRRASSRASAALSRGELLKRGAAAPSRSACSVAWSRSALGVLRPAEVRAQAARRAISRS